MAHNDDLVFYHSKSTALVDNEVGHDGLGGRISADVLTSLIARPSLMPGVVINSASGKNLAGIGQLIFTVATGLLQWKAPRDSAAGVGVNVSAGGTFELESVNTDSWIEIVSTAILLPLVNTTVNVVLEEPKNLIFPDVSFNDSMLGRQDFRCVLLKNIGGVTYNNVRPNLEQVAANVAVKIQTFYPQSGSARILVNDASLLPSSYFIRNKRTMEIMYYASKGGDDGNELVIPFSARGLRGTSPANGIAPDVLELISPFDISIAPYVPLSGTDVIIEDTVSPPSFSFFYPCPSDSPHYTQAFNLAAGSSLTIWLRRNIPEGIPEISKAPLRLGFLYES